MGISVTGSKSTTRNVEADERMLENLKALGYVK
jgi:hypothetical protein